jgi:RNA polymerase sigma factor (sigma-70 family)
MNSIKEKLSLEVKNEYESGFILNVENHSLLSKKDEALLIEMSQKNDNLALSMIVKYNHKLVLKIARKYQNRGVDFEDLVSEGKMGLMHSITKFDLSREFCLSTYSTLWIRQQIERYIMNNSRTIRIPIHLIKKISLINRKKKELETNLGYIPSLSELSIETEIDTKTILQLDELNKTVTLSNLSSGKGGDDFDLFNTMEDLNNESFSLEESLTMSKANDLMKCLDEKEKTIVILTFGMYKCDETSFRDIGKQLNLSGERIRQIHQKSLMKMKSHALERKISLSDFLTAA